MGKVGARFILVACIVSGPLYSADVTLIDDFSADTSANYTYEDSYGSGGSFEISGGTLNLATGGGNTASVMLDDGVTFLRPGMRFGVELQTDDNAFLMLSTFPGQPGGGTFGFRIRRDTGLGWRLQGVGGGDPFVTTGIDLGTVPQVIWADRITATEFEFYVQEACSTTRTFLGAVSNSDLAGVDDLFMGIQGFGGATFAFDNFQTQVISNLVDDFEADTSANYTYEDSYGSGGSFEISGGKLNVATGGSNTASVMLDDGVTFLPPGYRYSIDLETDDNAFLMLSTFPGQPGGGEFGFRIRRDGGLGWRLQGIGGGDPFVTTNIDVGSVPQTISADRITATEFEFYVQEAGAPTRTLLGAVSNSDLAGVNDLLVGVQGFGGATFAFDNLRIDPLPARIYDDYESDTSANYTYEDSYGSGGSFEISGGKLNLATGGGNTASVMVDDGVTFLRTGNRYGIDLETDDNAFLMLSTFPGQPGGGEFGFRIRRDGGLGWRLQGIGGGDPFVTTEIGVGAVPQTMWADRVTDTTFQFFVEELGTGIRTFLGCVENSDLAGVQDLYVGVQGFGGATFAFDNLRFEGIPTQPPGPDCPAEGDTTCDGLEITRLDFLSDSIIDDFSSDTSGSYVPEDSFGSGGSFTVADGTLNLTTGASNTFSVMLNDGSTFLDAGQTFEVDILDPGNSFLMLSTFPGQPNGTDSAGYRLRRDATWNIQRVGGDSQQTDSEVIGSAGPPGTAIIHRVTDTEFEFYFRELGSNEPTLIGTDVNTDLAGVSSLFVGVQAFAGSASLLRFDDFAFGSVTDSALEAMNVEGLYRVNASGTDESGDPILYTITTDNGVDDPVSVEQETGEAIVSLGEGSWTVSVTVDDDPNCDDTSPEDTCTAMLDVISSCPEEGDTVCDGVSLTLIPQVEAAVVDDFSADTSGSYAYEDSFGSGGGFAINTDTGKLELSTGGNNTASLVLNDGTFLGTRQRYAIDSETDANSFLLLTTSLGQPNGSDSFGFRIRRDATWRIQIAGGSGDTIDSGVPGNPSAVPETLWADRISDTEFEFYVEEAGSGVRTFLGAATNSDLDGVQELRVGVQGFGGSVTFGFDNLRIGDIPGTIVDDFSADTSGSYTLEDSFGSGGSFEISGGKLNLTTGGNNTASVMLTNGTDFLSVGERWSVDLETDDNAFMMVSTVPGQPNGTDSFGIRLRRDSSVPAYRAALAGGTGELIDNGISVGTTPQTMIIERTTATDFRMLFREQGASVDTLIAEASIPEVAKIPDLFVGVQGFGGSVAFVFDNLRLEEIPPATEGNPSGFYLASASATDFGGDPIDYTFTFDNGVDDPTVVGPQSSNEATAFLAEGDWTIDVSVDDDPECEDVAEGATCSESITISDCPSEGDTVCSGIETTMSPDGNGPGIYQFAVDATDDTGDDIIYTITADNGVDDPMVIGPRPLNTAFFDLSVGSWTITADVDDNPDCDDTSEGATCMITIEVLDVTPPEITCPDDITVEAEGPDGAVVSFDPPTVSDDVDPEPTRSCDPMPGDLFPVGMTTVTCIATDAAGNSAQCEFTVTVNPTGGAQIPGDCDQDGMVESDIGDLVCLLTSLYVDRTMLLPCGDGSATDPANVMLLDSNGDGVLDVADAMYLAGYQFGICNAGAPCPPHVLGTDCVRIQGCEADACEVP